MSGEIAVIAGSSVVGALSAAIFERLSRTKTKSDEKEPKFASSARIELASLLFEKTLKAEAITRVYEASQAEKIDRLERDRLLVRYKHELDILNEKIAYLQPVAEYADLSEMRNGLVSLIETQVSSLDHKLAEMSKSGISPIVVEKVRVMPIPEKSSDEHEKKQFKAEEKSIEQLQKEIMHALVRLEQVEMDKN